MSIDMQNPEPQVSLNESGFYKWRCLVALAHVDGKVTPEERNMIDLQLRSLFLTKEQHEIILKDYLEPQDVQDLYPYVTLDDDKRHLINLAYTLFWSDSEFHEAEEEIYNRLVNGFADDNDIVG